MKRYHTLAYRELLAQRVTSFLILLAIILSTMMTSVIGQSAGTLSAMRQQQAITIGGSQYATFVQMNERQIGFLQNDTRLSYVGVSMSLGYVTLNRALMLGLNEYHADALSAHPSDSKLKAGRLPQAPMEIALPEDVLQFLGFSGNLGDKISLSLSKGLRHGVETTSYDYTADFTLTGILESNYLGYAAGRVLGIAGAGSAAALLPKEYIYYNADIRTADKRSFQDTMDDLVSTLQVHELDTMYQTTYLNALGIEYSPEAADYEVSDEGFAFMLAAGIMVGALLLLAAGLVIYNILKIAVSRRMKQYGILRAIGSTKSQLYFLVTAQVLILCAVGIPVGLLLGGFSAQGILSAATSLLSPELFLVQDSAALTQLIADNSAGKWAYLLASAVTTLLFALAATLPAARFAAGISPVAAMSGTYAKIKRKQRDARRIRNFARYYAWLNLKRNRARTIITVFSLVMSITVFIALQSGVSLLNAAGGAEQKHLGDYSIINETVGFSAGELETMETDEQVAAVAAIQFSLYLSDGNNKPQGISLSFDLQPGETFQIIGLNDAYWDHYFGGKIPDAALELLKSGA